MKIFARKSIVALAALILFVVSPVLAQTLGERKMINSWNEQLKKEKESGFVKKCGYDIEVTLDPKLATPFMETTNSASGYCGEALIGMSRMCEDAEAKKAIVEKIKKLECKLGSKPEPSFKLNGSTLTFEFTTKSSNLSDATKKFLDKNL